MVNVVRSIPLLGAVALFALWAGSAVAAPDRPVAADPPPAYFASIPGEPSLRAPEQSVDEQSTEQAAAEESSNERTAWAVTAVALFFGFSAIGFIVALYGYSTGR